MENSIQYYFEGVLIVAWDFSFLNHMVRYYKGNFQKILGLFFPFLEGIFSFTIDFRHDLRFWEFDSEKVKSSVIALGWLLYKIL